MYKRQLVTYDPALTIQEIEKLDEICDYVVVYVHWGIERAEHPEEYQRTMGKQYIDCLLYTSRCV